MISTDLSQRRATVMGLGRHGGGVAAARFLAERGSRVTVTDLADEAALGSSLAQLSGVDVERLTLGRHEEADFVTTELLVVNPAVRPESPWVRIAREAGAVITSEIELFLRTCPATVIGVTGSNGKSTTAAMIAACLEAAGRKVYLGGNIERSLLPLVESMSADDVVVLELSSFQLAWLSDDCPRPRIAAITNFSTNHLDWHVSLDDYSLAKRRIVDARWTEQIVLGPLDGNWRRWAAEQGRVVEPSPVSMPQLRLPGEHNRWNAALAVATAAAIRVEPLRATRAVAEFAGLPHRLEVIGEFNRRRLINDSQATTPEATVAALHAIDAPTRVLVGGADKGADWRRLAEAMSRRAVSAACYGQTGAAMKAAILADSPEFPVRSFETLAEAAGWQWDQSDPGDVILLSPACSSLDQFTDYAHRAALFREVIAALSGQSSTAPNF